MPKVSKRQAVEPTLGKTVFDRYVLALDVAGLFQAVAECAQRYVSGNSTRPKTVLNHTCVQPKAGKSMKHPAPSDFIVNVQESHVSVIFKPSDSYYTPITSA